MATYLGTDNNGNLTYENQPEAKKTLFKNDKELTAEDVVSIVMATLASAGIDIGETNVTINKTLLVKDDTDPNKVLPVVVSDTGIRQIHFLSGFPGAIVARGNFGVDTIADKLIEIKDPS